MLIFFMYDIVKMQYVDNNRLFIYFLKIDFLSDIQYLSVENGQIIFLNWKISALVENILYGNSKKVLHKLVIGNRKKLNVAVF